MLGIQSVRESVCQSNNHMIISVRSCSQTSKFTASNCKITLANLALFMQIWLYCRLKFTFTGSTTVLDMMRYKWAYNLALRLTVKLLRMGRFHSSVKGTGKYWRHYQRFLSYQNPIQLCLAINALSPHEPEITSRTQARQLTRVLSKELLPKVLLESSTSTT